MNRIEAPLALALTVLLGLSAGGCCDSHRRSPVIEERQASAMPIKPQSRLRIETRSSDVRLVPGTGDSIRVLAVKRVQSVSERSAQSILRQIRVTMERTGDELVLRVREPERGQRRVRVQAGPWSFRRSVEIEVTVAVPRSIPVTFETENGDFEADGLEAPLILRSTSGDFDLTRQHAPVEVRTSGGDVVIREADGPITIQTTNGDVSAIAVQGLLIVRATRGDVSASRIAGGVRIETSSGDVEALDVLRGARVVTSTGDIVLRAGGDSLWAETATGDIDARALNAPVVTSLRSSSGDLLLKFPPRAGGRLEVQTADGSIHVENPLEVETMDRNHLTGQLGGRGLVSLRTSSGDITLTASGEEE